MPSNEATPFTIRDQLEKDAKRSIEAAIKAMLKVYRPHLPFEDDLHITRSVHNKVGKLVVRVRVEIAGADVEEDWLTEQG